MFQVQLKVPDQSLEAYRTIETMHRSLFNVLTGSGRQQFQAQPGDFPRAGVTP